jgi:hypothetical protein
VPLPYEGQLESAQIVAWALSLLPRAQLTEVGARGLDADGAAADALARALRHGGEPRLVLFADGPRRAEPTEAAIASALLVQGAVRFGQIDCADGGGGGGERGGAAVGFGGACGRLGVRFAPAAWYFTGHGEAAVEYDGKLLGARLAAWAAGRYAGETRLLGSAAALEAAADAAAADAAAASAGGAQLLLLGVRPDAVAHGAALRLELLRLRAALRSRPEASCADAAAECGGWAAAGECETNTGSMRDSCGRVRDQHRLHARQLRASARPTPAPCATAARARAAPAWRRLRRGSSSSRARRPSPPARPRRV